MQLLVDGVAVRTWNNVGGDVAQRQFLNFSYTHPTSIAINQIRVAFTNDGNTAGGADRNLAVDAIALNGLRYESEAPATYSTGTWSDATGCAPGNKQDEVLHCGGYFQYAGAQSGSRIGLHIGRSDELGGSTQRVGGGRMPLRRFRQSLAVRSPNRGSRDWPWPHCIRGVVTTAAWQLGTNKGLTTRFMIWCGD